MLQAVFLKAKKNKTYSELNIGKVLLLTLHSL